MQYRYHTVPTPDILSITHYTSGKYTVPIPDILSPTQCKTDIIQSPLLTYWASRLILQVNIPSPLLIYWATRITLQANIPSPFLTYWAPHSARQISYSSHAWRTEHYTGQVRYYTVRISDNEPHALNFRYHRSPLLTYRALHSVGQLYRSHSCILSLTQCRPGIITSPLRTY